jgi:hypothetical protein
MYLILPIMTGNDHNELEVITMIEHVSELPIMIGIDHSELYYNIDYHWISISR